MTPAQQAKEAGLQSLASVSDLTGVSYQTLSNWHRHKPELFRIVLLGCKMKTATIDIDIGDVIIDSNGQKYKCIGKNSDEHLEAD